MAFAPAPSVLGAIHDSVAPPPPPGQPPLLVSTAAVPTSEAAALPLPSGVRGGGDPTVPEEKRAPLESLPLPLGRPAQAPNGFGAAPATSTSRGSQSSGGSEGGRASASCSRWQRRRLGAADSSSEAVAASALGNRPRPPRLPILEGACSLAEEGEPGSNGEALPPSAASIVAELAGHAGPKACPPSGPATCGPPSHVLAAFRHHDPEGRGVLGREQIEAVFNRLGGCAPSAQILDNFTSDTSTDASPTRIFNYTDFLIWLYGSCEGGNGHSADLAQNTDTVTGTLNQCRTPASASTLPLGTEREAATATSSGALLQAAKRATPQEGEVPITKLALAERSIRVHGAVSSSFSTAVAPGVPNVAYECQKAATVTLLLLLGAGLLFGLLVRFAQTNFQAPECSEEETQGRRCCEPCGTGTNVLPLFGEFEQSWPKELRACLYLLAILWVFQGIGIICDMFMEAIEEITSAERVIWMKVRHGSKRKFTAKVWNPTMANLSLMALGSSAPEILLSLIEIVMQDFFIGELGTSTIVGSAAFNLLIITAVCITALPDNHTSRVQGLSVFAVTSIFSVFAYFWTWFILRFHTEDLVDPWEAGVTLACFPLLLAISFLADKGFLNFAAVRRANRVLSLEDSSSRLRAKYGTELSSDAIKALLMSQDSKRDLEQPPAPSRADFHRMIIRQLTSGSFASSKNTAETQYSPCSSRTPRGGDQLTVGFEKKCVEVVEGQEYIALKVVASRGNASALQLRYRTQEGSAKEGVRYYRAEGLLNFRPGEVEQEIRVPLLDDELSIAQGQAAREHFQVHLFGVSGVISSSRSLGKALEPQLLEDHSICTVTIINDDKPGTLAFDFPEVYPLEGCQAAVGVVRTDGACGKISCRYQTLPGTAKPHEEYTPKEGLLVFESGEVLKVLKIHILNFHPPAEEARFQVKLSDASEGVEFQSDGKGDAECPVCDIVISATPRLAVSLQRLWKRGGEACRKHFFLWAQQLGAAFLCGGSCEDQQEATTKDWFFHSVALFWKVLFAVVPPASICGGWACFVVSLLMIGLVTCLAGDLANLFGCCVGIPPDICGYTLVALGTSLPDTFASKLAAQQDETADNAIGNVTGSNSVNVFLGLGIPWTWAALYWRSEGTTLQWRDHTWKNQRYEDVFNSIYREGGGFVVPQGSLGFSVPLFTGFALTCITLLYFRRLKYGGELGGPKSAQARDSCFLVLLWVVFVGASAIRSLNSE